MPRCIIRSLNLVCPLTGCCIHAMGANKGDNIRIDIPCTSIRTHVDVILVCASVVPYLGTCYHTEEGPSVNINEKNLHVPTLIQNWASDDVAVCTNVCWNSDTTEIGSGERQLVTGQAPYLIRYDPW